jgi:LacI family transcriptional regulator
VVSLKDIAAELGISPGLVSKVLNGRLGTTGVSPARRDEIVARAKMMGYIPNRTARALKFGRLGSVGVFLHPPGELGTEISSLFLQGVSEALAASNSHLWLTFYSKDSEFSRELQISDIRQHADALVIAGVPHPGLLPALRQLDESGLPVVTALENHYSEHLPNVCVDNMLQGYLPTEHLIELGCRKIAHVATHSVRSEGYKAALQAAGIGWDPELLVKASDYKIETGRVAVRDLLNRNVEFDGIVAQSDHQALGIILELTSRGIAVPEKVRITGVDDSPLCAGSPIPITSVSSEAFEVGRLAVEMVLDRLKGSAPKSVSLKPRVIRRASS